MRTEQRKKRQTRKTLVQSPKQTRERGKDKGLRRILVPTDFSTPSKRAVAYAVSLADKLSGLVSLIHIEPSAWPADVDTLPLIIKRRNYLEAAQAWLERFRDEAMPAARRGEAHVGTGTPYKEIVRYAQATATDLLVVATHGYTGVKHLLLGSSAEHIVRAAPCSVLTIRPQPGRRTATPSMRKILVPTDFSESSRRSLEHAMEWAEHLGARITLLHVLELPAYPQYGYARIPTEERKRKKLATDRLAEMKTAAGSLVEAIRVRIGSPFEEIGAEAKAQKADLIVVSTHGYTGVQRLLLGSTAERVVRCAPCPVLVSRGQGDG